MDVDMAMQLSLARRETLNSSPVATFSTPPMASSQYDPSQQVASGSDSFTFRREDDDLLLHDHGLSRHQEYDQENIYEPSVDGDTLAPHTLQPTLQSTHVGPHHDHPTASNFGLPTYQANLSQSNFDFSGMEDFAEAEKTKLGLNTPVNTRFSLSAIRGRSKPQVDTTPVPAPTASGSSSAVAADGTTPTANVEQQASTSSLAQIGEEGTNEQASTRPLRHRKLSQSNTHPRTHRKGIGGKMALFESNSHETPSSFSARLGMARGQSGLPSGPSYDHIAGVPTTSGLNTGILVTGHDRPYRFSFYSNALSATIHARSLSELPADGQTFEQLFSGINPAQPNTTQPQPVPMENGAPKDRPPSSMAFSPPYQETVRPVSNNGSDAGSYFPNNVQNNAGNRRSVNGLAEKMGGGANTFGAYQDGNTWWLDVQSPTDEEMKMLSKVFSIHPLTTEDILMEETREKIELFRNYYLVCFRSFDQDPYSPTHLEPLNMYIIVFREGILSFHFRPTPHPQNVRRRIKQLKDYISVTSDWISYALIDDITDAFGPLIQGIEYEVDSIDELVLILKEAEQSDMLRRIGTCRKKVMGLLRLMGNKADVVKGLAKRCNENWRVAPTSDIGLYLSDIQDHLITMTQNLNHYEKILSRSHSNYLAQISIEMTDANNQINDVLSKLTALGTVLIPMNLVTGLWGMNVHVPGQDVEGYAWFVSIIACLAVFALVGGYSTYKLMIRK